VEDRWCEGELLMLSCEGVVPTALKYHYLEVLHRHFHVVQECAG
jgi:hypothetical protein